MNAQPDELLKQRESFSAASAHPTASSELSPQDVTLVQYCEAMEEPVRQLAALEDLERALEATDRVLFEQHKSRGLLPPPHTLPLHVRDIVARVHVAVARLKDALAIRDHMVQLAHEVIAQCIVQR